MKEIIVFKKILLGVIMGLWVAAISFADPNWNVVYDGSVEPPSASPSWDLYLTDYASSNGSILTIDTIPSDPDIYCSYRHQNPGHYWHTNVSNSTGWTVEFKLKVGALESSARGQISASIYDDSKYILVNWGTDKIELGDNFSGGTWTAYSMNTTSDYHTYRLSGKGSAVRLYVDNVERMSTSLFSGGGWQLFFGDQTAVASSNSTSYWDYVKYYTGGAVSAEGNFTVTGSHFPTLSISENKTNQVALGVSISTLANLTITKLPVDIIEGTSGALNYISKVSIYLDTDQDGIIDTGETLLGSRTSPTADNLLTLSGLILNNETKYLLIALDFSNTYGLPNTYNFRVKVPPGEAEATDSSSFVCTSSSTSDVLSNVHSILAGTYAATLSYNSVSSSSWSTLANQTVKVLDFFVSTTDNLSFNSFIVNITEQNLLDKFASMKLYRDSNNDGSTEGETVIQQVTTFSSDNITFNPGTTLNDTTHRYLVELITSGSSGGTSSNNQTFSFKADPVNFNLTQNGINASISGASMILGKSITFTAPGTTAATTATSTTKSEDFGLVDALVGATAAGAAGAVEAGLQ